MPTVQFTRSDRSRVLTHQCEAGGELEAMMSLLREIVSRCVEAHAAGTRAGSELVQANRVVSDSLCATPEQVAS